MNLLAMVTQAGRELSDIGRNLVAVYSAFSQFFSTVIAITFASMLIFPILIILSMAMRPTREVFADPVSMPSALNFENLLGAWSAGGFSHYVLNSVIVVGIALVVLVVVSSLAAYALVEFDLPRKEWLLLAIIAGFIVPPEVLIVPLFMIMNDVFGWINHYRALIIVYVAMGIPFSVFFLRQFFMMMPDSYAEAARLDGCSELQVFSRIYLPLSIPAVATVAVFQFVLFWNEFLYALVFLTRDELRTAPAGLLAFQGGHETDYAMLAAAVLIAALPTILVFLAFRNQFIRGFTMGRV